MVPEAAVAVCARDGGGIPELLAKVEEALLNLNAMVKCTYFMISSYMHPLVGSLKCSGCTSITFCFVGPKDRK